MTSLQIGRIDNAKNEESSFFHGLTYLDQNSSECSIRSKDPHYLNSHKDLYRISNSQESTVSQIHQFKQSHY